MTRSTVALDSVYAELTIQSKKDLPEELKVVLPKRFGDPSDKARAINATTFPKDFEEGIVYQKHTPQRVFLVLQDEASTLKVHIEDAEDKTQLPRLQSHVEEIAMQMERFLKHQRNRTAKMRIVVTEGVSTIQTGAKLNWWNKLKLSITENALPKIYVPVATFVASILVGYEDRALLNVLAALVAMALWVVLDTTFIAKSYKYK